MASTELWAGIRRGEAPRAGQVLQAKNLQATSFSRAARKIAPEQHLLEALINYKGIIMFVIWYRRTMEELPDSIICGHLPDAQAIYDLLVSKGYYMMNERP